MGAWALAAAFILTYLLAGGSPHRYDRREGQSARNGRAVRIGLVVVVVLYAIWRLARPYLSAHTSP